MIEEQALIIEKFDREVSVEIERSQACGICGQTRGCGNATLGRMLGHTQSAIRAENRIDANVGDHVVIGVEERVFLRSVLYLYGLPLITLFIGAWLINKAFDNELYTMIGALFGLFIGFFAVKICLNQSAKQSSLPQIYAVVLRQAQALNSKNQTS